MKKYIKTCLNRFIGRCPHCVEDYDTLHKPNNLDCPHYRETKLLVFENKTKKNN